MTLPLIHAGRTNPGLSAALDLRFASSLSLTSTSGITPSFSRASTGSYFDDSGVLRYAALNLLTYSEDFTNAVWLKTNSSISSNVATSPTGTLTAEKLVENTAGPTTHLVTYNSATTGTLFSVYAKAGERGWMALQQSNSGRFCYFDLVNGVVGTASGATGSIASAGNGWYRCSILVPSGSSVWDIFLATGDNGATYTGNGISGLFVWGAQLEASSTVGAYVQTTSSANSAPRFNHTYNGSSWVSKGLLIEEQRTNSVLHSNDISGAGWIRSNGSFISNSQISPDITLNAGEYVGNNGAGYFEFYRQLSLGSGIYTNSIFLKSSGTGADIVSMYGYAGMSPVGWFNLANGTSQSGTELGISYTATIKNCGNGWFRCSITNNTARTCSYIFPCRPTTAMGGTTDLSGNGVRSVYIYGAQLESGSFPTSYIPTTTAAVTRSADVCQITGDDFSGFWNASEGSFAVEADSIGFASTGSNRFFYTAQSSGTAFYSLNIDPAVGLEYRVFNSSMQAQLTHTQPNAGVLFKHSLCYKVNDFASSLNGSAVGTDTSGTLPTATSLGVGYFPGFNQHGNCHIARLRYYPVRLPNATLQVLST